jgi:hypothetical protein
VEALADARSSKSCRSPGSIEAIVSIFAAFFASIWYNKIKNKVAATCIHFAAFYRAASGGFGPIRTGTGANSCPLHPIPRVETQSIREVATGSIACRFHQASSFPKLWTSR